MPSNPQYSHKREPFMSHNPDGVQTPFVAPPGFEDITYTIQNTLFVPVVRKNQAQPDFSQNTKNQNYKFPIHNPNTKIYKLLCTLDKMRVGDHIEIKDKDNYYYALTQANLYAIKIRKDKKANMQFRFRGAYDVAHNIGRIWRIA